MRSHPCNLKTFQRLGLNFPSKKIHTQLHSAKLLMPLVAALVKAAAGTHVQTLTEVSHSLAGSVRVDSSSWL